jgi:hypothetical protein
MAKDRFEKGGSIVWPPLSFPGDSSRDGRARRKNGQENRETPEEMVRSLQGIFCKGRYRSWQVRQG